MNILFIKNGEKRVINRKVLAGALIITVSLIILGVVFFPEKGPVGFSKKTENSLSKNIPENTPKYRGIKFPMEEDVVKNAPVIRMHPFKKPLVLILNAKQVISRNETTEIPTGINLIGKLLTPIDTRDLSTPVRVILPYGARQIEKNTVLEGHATYPGRGEKIFLSFERAVSPDGKDFSLSAIALDSKDFTSGIYGDLHSEKSAKVAAGLGLTIISAMTDVLTQKTSFGDGFIVTPKATLQNAAFHGASKAAEAEASRQMQDLEDTPSYLTKEAGSDLIVSINQNLKEKNP